VNLSYQYSGRSHFSDDASAGAHLGFSTNLLREATFFSGQLAQPLLAREGFAALYDVVVSDFKWRPKERLAYRLWLESQDRAFCANFGVHALAAKQQIAQLNGQLAALDAAQRLRRAEFTQARMRYMSFAARDEMEAFRVLDPVITVHPDELSFEAFSRDQSAYARLRVSYEVFSRIEGFECGTTNIDFSHALHLHLDRLRSYRQTRLEIGAGGFASRAVLPAEPGDAAAEAFEKRIELPDGWMQGFLNVHGLISMGLTKLTLAPIEVLNVLNYLMAHKTRASPRALRFELSPGKPVRMVLEPWDVSFWCSPVSVYQGSSPASIRIWGRERLRSLLRVLPVADSVDVYLAGSGLPSVWVAHVGAHVSLTLALSGWTDNDWVEGDGSFALLNKRLNVSAPELDAVYQLLRTLKRAPYADLAARSGLAVEKVKSAVSVLAQAGRAMFDLREGVPRHRDLLLEPFSAMRAARLSVQLESKDPRAVAAKALFNANQIMVIATRPVAIAADAAGGATPAGYKLSGSCAQSLNASTRMRPQLHVDHAGAIIEASCTCEAMQRHGLSKGPCEHVLALRLAHMAKLEQGEHGKQDV
jgi:hypothetical protein